MNLYAIEHIPTKRLYTPNDNGAFRDGRNWRKSKAVYYSDASDAVNEIVSLVDQHRAGIKPLRIRGFGGYDAARPEDIVGDGYIRDRDFRVVEL